MVVKMGYRGEHGIEMWRYVDEIKDVRIVGFETETYFVQRKDVEKGDEKHSEFKYYYRKYIGKRDGMNVPYEDVEIDIPCVWFNTDVFNQDCQMIWLTMIFDISGNNTYACMSDSVYVMNDQGKTVDKY